MITVYNYHIRKCAMEDIKEAWMRLTAIVSLITLSIISLCIAPSPVNAQMTYWFRADSTMDGNAGSVFRITDSGFGQDVFIFEEDGKYRVFAIREDGSDWAHLTPAQYFCPVMTMTIGDNWRFVNDNMTEETRATVAAQEEITVPAGTFICYRIEIVRVAAPDEVNQMMWLAFGVGMVKEQYFEGNGYWHSDLDDRFVVGTGFMPRTAGNWWTYGGYLIGTDESSWGEIKKHMKE
jgi:hypothetical protein